MIVLMFWLVADQAFQQQLRAAMASQPELQQALDEFLNQLPQPTPAP